MKNLNEGKFCKVDDGFIYKWASERTEGKCCYRLTICILFCPYMTMNQSRLQKLEYYFLLIKSPKNNKYNNSDPQVNTDSVITSLQFSPNCFTTSESFSHYIRKKKWIHIHWRGRMQVMTAAQRYQRQQLEPLFYRAVLCLIHRLVSVWTGWDEDAWVKSRYRVHSGG